MKNIQVTDDMIGKKVTCLIYSTLISDAKIQKQDETYYICQDSQAGSSCNDKLGYSHSWSIKTGRAVDMENHNVSKLKFAESEIPKNLPIFN